MANDCIWPTVIYTGPVFTIFLLGDVDFCIIPYFCIVSITFFSSSSKAIGTLRGGCRRDRLFPVFMVCSIRFVLPKSTSSLENASVCLTSVSATAHWTACSLSFVALWNESVKWGGISGIVQLELGTSLQPQIEFLSVFSWCCKNYDLLQSLLVKILNFLKPHHMSYHLVLKKVYFIIGSLCYI